MGNETPALAPEIAFDGALVTADTDLFVRPSAAKKEVGVFGCDVPTMFPSCLRFSCEGTQPLDAPGRCFRRAVTARCVWCVKRAVLRLPQGGLTAARRTRRLSETGVFFDVRRNV